MSTIQVAGVQMGIRLADPQHNLDQMRQRLEVTVAAGAELTVFPECTLSGYCFESLEEALAWAQPMDGDAVGHVTQWCQEMRTTVIFGLLEKDQGKLFNSLALVGPQGLLGRYRKVHLPFLGVDRFTTSGDGSEPVVDLGELRVGLNICYDSSFPESARNLALQGADLIALPTNWPPTSGLTADVIPNARALENHIYYMSINRIGQERGFEFIGKSKICDPRGRALAFADHNQEAILYAEIDPQLARQKHLVARPGEHEVHRFRDRHPETYQRLVEPVADAPDCGSAEHTG